VRVLLAFVGLVFSFGSAEIVNFDGVRAGSRPPDWTFVSTRTGGVPHWQIELDKTAPSHPQVLAQVAWSGRQDHSLAIFDKGLCANGEVSVDFKMMSGRSEQSAGLVWRFQDPGNYYFALAGPAEDRVSIFKRVNNRVSLVAPAVVSHSIDDRQWSLMKVTFQGPKFTLYFGHRKILEARDSTLPASGRTGVWARADTVAYFDNFRLDKRN